MVPETRSRDAASASDGESIAALIERWQSNYDRDALAVLLEVIRPALERVVARMLRRRGMRDPGACDDAWALVIEHLARLGGADGGRHLVAFDASRASDRGTDDPGWAYVRCLARARARDVARERSRRERRAANLTRIAVDASSPGDVDEPPAEAGERLRAAVASLDEQSRTVIALLLEGKTQTVIAHMLGVCEGTVSRIRSRAIVTLRRLMTE